MATATMNPLLNNISGRIGNVVFYKRLGKHCVRIHVIPHNPDTQAQRNMRCTFAHAIKSWQSMSGEEKYAFTRKARNLCMSGYNLYISHYMKANYITASNLKSKLLPEKTYPSPVPLRFLSVSNPIMYANLTYNDYHHSIKPYMRL